MEQKSRPKTGRSQDRSNLQHYVLRGGATGARRLQLLIRVCWPTTKRLLRRAGLQPGMRCLDAGCGIGAVTMGMARLVGPAGQAVGIDLDQDYLDQASQEAGWQNLPASFRSESVSDLTDQATYDLAYSRFLLAHLPDPALVLARITRAVKPGGVVVIEDVQFTGHFCYPACAAFDRYVNLYQEVLRHKGGDANIGPRLPGLLGDAGLEKVKLEVVQPTFCRGAGKLMVPLTMEHTREALVQAGLASDAELTTLVAELEAFARNPQTIVSMPRIFQVWGHVKQVTAAERQPTPRRVR